MSRKLFMPGIVHDAAALSMTFCLLTIRAPGFRQIVKPHAADRRNLQMTRQQTRHALRRQAKASSAADWRAAMTRKQQFRRMTWRDLYVSFIDAHAAAGRNSA